MSESLLLRGANQLLTLRGPNTARRGAALRNIGVIEDGSVLIRDGLIASIGPTRRMENLKEARNVPELSVSGFVVMPGFADPGLRLSLTGPIDGSGKFTKPKNLAAFATATRSLLRSCRDHGTLSVHARANAGFGSFRSDLSVLRQLAALGRRPVDMVQSWCIEPANREQHADLDYAASFQFLVRRNLAQAVEIPDSPGQDFSDRIWAAARQSSLALNLSWPAGSAVRLADYLRRAMPRAVFSPSNLTPGECVTLARSPTITVFSPSNEMIEGRCGGALRRIADEGGPIALASGYGFSRNQSFNMQTALALAVLRLGLTPEEAISAATVNAAHAMGVGNSAGRIEIGRPANLLVLAVPDYRELPRHLELNQVELVIRDGEVV